MLLTNGPNYTFPIGKNTYNAFELVEPNTNGFGDFDLKVNLVDTNTGATFGTGMNSIRPNLIWDAQIVTLNNSFVSARVKLNDSSIYAGSNNGLASSQLINGAFDNVTSSIPDSFQIVSNNQISNLGYFALGVKTPSLPVLAELKLKVLVQGLYVGNGKMVSALFNADPTVSDTLTDSITVELHENNSATIYSVIYSQKAAITTSGNSVFNFPSAVVGNSYYVVIKHRNSIPIWTAAPITLTFNNTVDLTANASDVYGSNLAELETGIFGMYSGDINQDGFIDGNDFIDVDNDNTNFASGYLTTDVNGDAFVDGNDFVVIDNNNTLFIGVANP
jgi:hypothetical protein